MAKGGSDAVVVNEEHEVNGLAAVELLVLLIAKAQGQLAAYTTWSCVLLVNLVAWLWPAQAGERR